jgi:putative lipoic acid-binding regulatory protein
MVLVYLVIRGGPGHKISVWLKIIGATGKKLFIVIILVKQQTIYGITSNKTCISKKGTSTNQKIIIQRKKNQQTNKLYQKSRNFYTYKIKDYNLLNIH